MHMIILQVARDLVLFPSSAMEINRGSDEYLHIVCGAACEPWLGSGCGTRIILTIFVQSELAIQTSNLFPYLFLLLTKLTRMASSKLESFTWGSHVAEQATILEHHSDTGSTMIVAGPQVSIFVCSMVMVPVICWLYQKGHGFKATKLLSLLSLYFFNHYFWQILCPQMASDLACW